jgi:hypothetical protein
LESSFGINSLVFSARQRKLHELQVAGTSLCRKLSGGQLRNFADYSVEMLGLRNVLAPVWVLVPVRLALAPVLAFFPVLAASLLCVFYYLR